MKKWHVMIVVSTFMVIFVAAIAGTSAQGKEKEQKTGILLVAFGSSKASAKVSFDNIDKKVKAAYPDIPVKWAFSSHIIRKKLAGQGKIIDSPEVALAKMLDEGFTHVAVQSLHTIAGAEYHDLGKVVDGFQSMGGFASVLLGSPLLATQKDMERVVDAILTTLPQERKKDEAIVLMGHGTHHPANAFYGALAFQLQMKDPHVFLGTVAGYPDLDTILTLLQKNNVKKAYLVPFMSVAGEHAKNDMAGDGDDSWKSIITKAGIECIPVLKGTAESDQFVDIWVDHLVDILNHFKSI